MSTLSIDSTIGEIVAANPALSRIFEEAGIDYCCGGKRSIAEACRSKGLDPQRILGRLESAAAERRVEGLDPMTLSLTELADHIVATHHQYLRDELPRLDMLTAKVARVHGPDDERLVALREVFCGFADEIGAHMMKEEQILFPAIRQLDSDGDGKASHCGGIAAPIRVMEQEHDGAGAALERMSELTERYTPPAHACNTYRAMLDALRELQEDMHQHVHKENNILFPRALEREGAAA